MRLFLLLCAVPLWAQVTTGSISGYVLDPKDNPVPQAEVVATQAERGIQRTARTDATGFYLLAELPPATYRVSAKAAGFDTVSRDDLRVAVNTRLRADFRPPVSGIKQAVEVAASVPLMQTESSDLGTVFDQARIEDLPLNRRNFLQLALLAPGVLPAVQNSELSKRGSVAMHAGGAREEYNNFLMDGIDNNDQYENTFALQPSVDSIQEFKLATSNYSAEFGRDGGGQVNVITRGGGSEWHGALYEYLRNRSLDARNFFDGAGKPQLIRNQFGLTAGGPAVRERSFIFVNFDGLRERQGLTRLATVPVAAERAGDLSALGKTILDPFTRQPFPGNRIPASRIAPLARRVLDLFPLATSSGDSGNYLAQPVLKESLSQFHGRFDHRLAAADQLTLRYSYGVQDLTEPYTQELTDVPGFGDVVTNSGHNAMVHETHVFSARTIQSLRLGFNRTFRQVLPQNHATDVGHLWGVGYLNIPERDFGYPLFNVAGFSHAGDATQLPISRHISGYQMVEGVSLLRSNHSLKVGGELRLERLAGFLDYYTRGSMSFSGVISGSGISDLLLGFPSFGIQATSDNRQALRSSFAAGYVQDDWKVRRNLTLNAGLRYELQTPPSDPADRMSIFDLKTQRVVPVGAGGISRSGLRTDWNNFAPRIGLAWTPARNLVVRGGYGLFYEQGMFVVNSSLYFNPPYFNTRIFFPSATSLLTLSNPFPTAGGVTPPTSPNTLSPDITTGYLQQWNFTLQRQVGAATTVSAAYAGSKGTHLIRSRDLNQPPPGPGDLQSRRPNPDFGGIFFIESGANSSFHSLQLSLDRRLTALTSVLASYTWSKSIDDTSAFLGNVADKNFPQSSRNIRAERALSSYDVPHRFVAACVHLLPRRHWWSRNIALRGIATAQSGAPFTPILRFDNSNTGNTGGQFGSDRPNLLRDPRLAGPGPERWFDPSAFAIAPRYQFGTAGRNIVQGPGVVNFDVAAERRFAIRERARLTVDVEAFNLFNHAQFDLPEHFVDEPATFARIFSAKAPRQLQFALRLGW